MIEEQLLADLLLSWEEHFEQGEELPAEELCQKCPELTAALAKRIRSLKKVAWVKTPLRERQFISPASELESAFIEPVTLAGRYRLEKLIAEGGSGQVFRGFDEELQRPVAVKVPKKRCHRAEDEEAFLIEARKVARLKHSGIVPVHDVGRNEGVYFIVSDLIDGHDLGVLLRQKTLSVREGVRIVADAARHLHYAHQQGLIHRDIKPPNLLVDHQGQVYITDFGIAATVEQLRLRGDDGCGTLAYMSPEQLFGDNARIDSRTDIYSLGVVLYQLITQQHPFEADTSEALQDCILRQEPRNPRSINPRIPREVERICQKCLSKSPVNRYATSDELAVALTHSLRKRWRSRFAFVMLTVMIAVIGLIAIGTTQQGAGERPPATTNDVNNRSLSANGGHERRLSLPNRQPDSPILLIPVTPGDDEGAKFIKPVEYSPEPTPSELLIKIRDRLVGIAYADLSKVEQDIADLMIVAGLLRINEVGKQRLLEKVK